MIEKKLDIKDTDIYERIKNESGFTSQIKAIAGQSTKLASMAIATDDEKIFFDAFIQPAVNECVLAINHYLSPCNVTAENDTQNTSYRIRHFNLMVPENYPEENVSMLGDILVDYITNRCLQQWYMLTKSDDVGTSALKVQTAMTLLRDMLSMRKKPV